jgi:hypothetical protein
MTPSLPQQLIAQAMTIATRIAPAIPETSYAMGDVGMLAGVLVMLAQEADRTVDVLVRENTAMRALFADAGAMPLGDLVDELKAAGASSDADLKITTLEAANARLKTLLIALHVEAEAVGGDWGRKLEARIWALLKRSADDRMLVMPAL